MYTTGVSLPSMNFGRLTNLSDQSLSSLSVSVLPSTKLPLAIKLTVIDSGLLASKSLSPAHALVTGTSTVINVFVMLNPITSEV